MARSLLKQAGGDPKRVVIEKSVAAMQKVNITHTFQQVFFTVVSLTLLSGGTLLWLASQEHLSEQQNQVFETCSATWQMGIGAVFGLLGSKATDLFYQEREEPEEE